MKRTLVGTLLLAGLVASAMAAYSVVSRDRRYHRLIQEGDAFLAAGQTVRAIEAFSGALGLKPDSMLAHLKRGQSYRRRGELPAALSDLRAASRLDPTAPRPWEEIGDVNYALERDARAIEAYEVHIGLDDRSPRVLYKLGLARHRAGDLTGSVAALRQAIVVDDRFAEAYYLLGLCLKERRPHADAIQALERATALQPALVSAREELADLYARRGRYPQEVQQLEALAALEPDSARRQIALGLSYARADPSTAVMALERAADRLPDRLEIPAAMAQVWLRAAEEHGDEAALRNARDALETIATQPRASGDIVALYGRALLLAGDAARAEQILQEAASKFPVELETFLHLATAASRVGHLDAARRALIQHDVLSLDESTQATRAARIGDLSLRLNDFAGAVRCYERAAAGGHADGAIVQKLEEARRGAANPGDGF